MAFREISYGQRAYHAFVFMVSRPREAGRYFCALANNLAALVLEAFGWGPPAFEKQYAYARRGHRPSLVRSVNFFGLGTHTQICLDCGKSFEFTHNQNWQAILGELWCEPNFSLAASGVKCCDLLTNMGKTRSCVSNTTCSIGSSHREVVLRRVRPDIYVELLSPMTLRSVESFHLALKYIPNFRPLSNASLTCPDCSVEPPKAILGSLGSYVVVLANIGGFSYIQAVLGHHCHSGPLDPVYTLSYVSPDNLAPGSHYTVLIAWQNDLRSVYGLLNLDPNCVINATDTGMEVRLGQALPNVDVPIDHVTVSSIVDCEMCDIPKFGAATPKDLIIRKYWKPSRSLRSASYIKMIFRLISPDTIIYDSPQRCLWGSFGPRSGMDYGGAAMDIHGELGGYYIGIESTEYTVSLLFALKTDGTLAHRSPSVTTYVQLSGLNCRPTWACYLLEAMPVPHTVVYPESLCSMPICPELFNYWHRSSWGQFGFYSGLLHIPSNLYQSIPNCTCSISPISYICSITPKEAKDWRSIGVSKAILKDLSKLPGASSRRGKPVFKYGLTCIQPYERVDNWEKVVAVDLSAAGGNIGVGMIPVNRCLPSAQQYLDRFGQHFYRAEFKLYGTYEEGFLLLMCSTK